MPWLFFSEVPWLSSPSFPLDPKAESQTLANQGLLLCLLSYPIDFVFYPCQPPPRGSKELASLTISQNRLHSQWMLSFLLPSRAIFFLCVHLFHQTYSELYLFISNICVKEFFTNKVSSLYSKLNFALPNLLSPQNSQIVKMVFPTACAWNHYNL